jgi:hypothetical protein
MRKCRGGKAVGARADNFVAFMCWLLEMVGAPGALRACSGLFWVCFSFISIRFLEKIKEIKLAVMILYKNNNLHERQFYFENCWLLN